jgi:hypothetical protein
MVQSLKFKRMKIVEILSTLLFVISLVVVLTNWLLNAELPLELMDYSSW